MSDYYVPLMNHPGADDEPWEDYYYKKLTPEELEKDDPSKYTVCLYIGYPNVLSSLNDLLDDFLMDSRNAGKFNLISDFELHITLTNTVQTQPHWFLDFMNTMKGQITPLKKFCLAFDSWKIYLNEDKSKTFFALKVADNPQLLNMLARLETALDDYNLPFFFEEPSFHLSLFWADGNQMDNWEQNEKINFDNFYNKIMEMMVAENVDLTVNGISCRYGVRKRFFMLND